MAKNIGLAAQLAKQAAQAAREEGGGGISVSKAPRAGSGWVPSKLPADFNVDLALTKAATKVAAHYRQVLAPEGLHIAVVTEPLQGVQAFQADLREGETGRLVRAYTAGDLLTMYASQQRLNGVVVDGQV